MTSANWVFWASAGPEFVTVKRKVAVALRSMAVGPVFTTSRWEHCTAVVISLLHLFGSEDGSLSAEKSPWSMTVAPHGRSFMEKAKVRILDCPAARLKGMQ